MPSGAVLKGYKINTFLFTFLLLSGFTGVGLTSYWLSESGDKNPDEFENKNNTIDLSSSYFISGMSLMSISFFFLIIMLYLGHKSKDPISTNKNIFTGSVQ